MNEINLKEKNLDEILQLVSFKIENEEFGIEISKVHEIIRLQNITKIPNAPHFVDGVINLRGKVIPVIDLRAKLNFPRKIFDKDSRIIVVEVESKKIGFIVDRVEEVIRISKSVTEAPPDLMNDINSDYILSVGKLENKLLILLDLEKVLSQDEISELN